MIVGETMLNRWIRRYETLTYSSAYVFTISGDYTSIYKKGRFVQLVQSATTKYLPIHSSSFGSGTTTVTCVTQTNYSLTNNAITEVYVTENNFATGLPVWWSYTPTFSAGGSMTVASVSIEYAKFMIQGNTTYFHVKATMTTGGTANPNILFTTPTTIGTSAVLAFSAWIADAGSFGGFGYVNTTTQIGTAKYNNANFGLGSNRSVACSGFYEW